MDREKSEEDVREKTETERRELILFTLLREIREMWIIRKRYHKTLERSTQEVYTGETSFSNRVKSIS